MRKIQTYGRSDYLTVVKGVLVHRMDVPLETTKVMRNRFGLVWHLTGINHTTIEDVYPGGADLIGSVRFEQLVRLLRTASSQKRGGIPLTVNIQPWHFVIRGAALTGCPKTLVKKETGTTIRNDAGMMMLTHTGWG